MNNLYIIICQAVSIGRNYANRMGWKESNCAFITSPGHIKGVFFDPGEQIHVILPVAEQLWECLLHCTSELEPGQKVNFQLVADP